MNINKHSNNISHPEIFRCFNLSNKQISKIENLIEKYINKLDNGVILDKNSESISKTYRSSQISWLPYNNDTKWLYDLIERHVKFANDNTWNFHLDGTNEGFQYGEYHASEKGHYDWHMDIGGNIVNRKISISIQLSHPNEYSGGKLQFMTSKKINSVPKKKGTIILFPLYLLYRVTPVTKGIIKSLVIWFSGNNFR